MVSGLPLTGDHPMHPFTIDAQGHIYVNVGRRPMPARYQNRVARSAGHSPCAELETRAGIWRFDANKTGQHFSPAERYATGIRNAEGFSFDASGQLFVTQHGRDQLWQNWPQFYTPEQGAELPAEEIVELKAGGDYGWPECYFDGFQKKLVLAPEYGGDGGKKVGICAAEKGSGRVLSFALGAERSVDFHRQGVSGGLSRRRLHCFPRLVESRTGAAGRL